MQLAEITHAYRAFSSFCGAQFSYNKFHNIANWSQQPAAGDIAKILLLNFYSFIMRND